MGLGLGFDGRSRLFLTGLVYFVCLMICSGVAARSIASAGSSLVVSSVSVSDESCCEEGSRAVSIAKSVLLREMVSSEDVS